LVEHHLAKVGVAGSNPVVRSRSGAVSGDPSGSTGDTLGDRRDHDQAEQGGLSPDEVVRSCLGEIWRYRLAIQVQLSRIKPANEAVLEERKQIEKDERELLFAPSMSADSFHERLESIHYRDVPLIGTLKTEGQFLLVAVYGILSMSKGIRRVSVGDMNGCVQQAIGAFEKAAPDADLLRHLHEHSDAYIRGEGKDRHRLPDPSNPGAVTMLDEGLAYFIGGKLFLLGEIAQAAEKLGRAVHDCTEEVILP
jgi:hypothetical protein